MLKKFFKFFVMFGLVFTGLNMFFYDVNSAYTHGTGYRQSELKAVALEFLYSTGEMMSYREAKVYSPQDDDDKNDKNDDKNKNKFAVQTGRTDEHGRFAFVPDKAGEWLVVVTDEEGHRAEAKINISQEFLDLNKNQDKNNIEIQAQNSNLISSNEIYFRAALGVSILFNIAALILKFTKNKGAA